MALLYREEYGHVDIKVNDVINGYKILIYHKESINIFKPTIIKIRIVEAENLDKYLVVFDFVNNFSSVNDGIGLLKEIKEAIAKEK